MAQAPAEGCCGVIKGQCVGGGVRFVYRNGGCSGTDPVTNKAPPTHGRTGLLVSNGSRLCAGGYGNQARRVRYGNTGRHSTGKGRVPFGALSVPRGLVAAVRVPESLNGGEVSVRV